MLSEVLMRVAGVSHINGLAVERGEGEREGGRERRREGERESR